MTISRSPSGNATKSHSQSWAMLWRRYIHQSSEQCPSWPKTERDIYLKKRPSSCCAIWCLPSATETVSDICVTFVAIASITANEQLAGCCCSGRQPNFAGLRRWTEGRATVTLGIGPHSSCVYFCSFYYRTQVLLAPSAVVFGRPYLPYAIGPLSVLSRLSVTLMLVLGRYFKSVSVFGTFKSVRYSVSVFKISRYQYRYSVFSHVCIILSLCVAYAWHRSQL